MWQSNEGNIGGGQARATAPTLKERDVRGEDRTRLRGNPQGYKVLLWRVMDETEHLRLQSRACWERILSSRNQLARGYEIWGEAEMRLFTVRDAKREFRQ